MGFKSTSYIKYPRRIFIIFLLPKDIPL